jgi:hypothetical protein
MEREDYISKIRVIYDFKFIEFIKKLRRDNDLSGLSLDSIEIVLPVQEKLREYIVNNQHLFELQCGKINYGTESHPDFFAIMICVIIPNLEEYSNFNEILHESKKGLWDMQLFSSATQEEGFEAYAGIGFKCACNHICSPENLFIINNIHSKQNILIGCDCSEKTGFIEPEVIKNIKKESEHNPIYKKAIENTKRNNELKHKEKICTELQKLRETKESIINDYIYCGGNSGEDLDYFNKNSNGLNIDELCDVDKCDKCDTCNQKISNILLLSNKNDDCLRICKKCCDYFGKMPKKSQRICEDCGSEHRNRSDNYCNECRQKTYCNECKKKDICNTNGHCKDCVEKYIFCKDCKYIKVLSQGWRCNQCYSKLKKCRCGKPITNPKYTSCFGCKR